MGTLKAYEVREDYEGHCTIAFATNNATARRQGGRELNLEFDEVESCRRAPQYDAYAPGPVPPLVLIENGWWFECHHCGKSVTDDKYDYEEDEPLEPVAFGDSGVFCCATCEAAHYVDRRAEVSAKANLIEAFEARHPKAEIVHVHAYIKDGALCTGERGCGVVTFRFPGCTYSATWDFSDQDHVMVSQCDIEAFHAWRGSAPLQQGGV